MEIGLVCFACLLDFGHFIWLERSTSESDGEPFAPNADGFEIVEICAGGDFVVLVTDIAFDRAEVDEPFTRNFVGGSLCSFDQVDADIGAV